MSENDQSRGDRAERCRVEAVTLAQLADEAVSLKMREQLLRVATSLLELAEELDRDLLH